MLKEKLPDTEAEKFLAAYKSGDLEVLYQLIDQNQIPEATKDLLINIINDAKDCLDNLSNLGLKLALYEVLGKIFKEYL